MKTMKRLKRTAITSKSINVAHLWVYIRVKITDDENPNGNYISTNNVYIRLHSTRANRQHANRRPNTCVETLMRQRKMRKKYNIIVCMNKL